MRTPINPLHPHAGWTPERVDLLTKMWKDGCSCSEIARKLGGVSRNACIGKIHRLGLMGRVEAYKPGRPFAAPKPRLIARPAKPALKLAGRGTVFVEAEARPPTVVVPFREEPATPTAKPWQDRSPFECTWIVAGEGADALCCAAPIHGRGWCLGHYNRGNQPSSLNKRASEPFQARATARFA